MENIDVLKVLLFQKVISGTKNWRIDPVLLNPSVYFIAHFSSLAVQSALHSEHINHHKHITLSAAVKIIHTHNVGQCFICYASKGTLDRTCSNLAYDFDD